jgi:hypothetical protein
MQRRLRKQLSVSKRMKRNAQLVQQFRVPNIDFPAIVDAHVDSKRAKATLAGLPTCPKLLPAL